MAENLINLADYSRQMLQVGTPPLNIYTENGFRPSQEIIQLSLLARIADALEGERIQRPAPELADEPNTWVLPNYCNSWKVQQDINELVANAPNGHPPYVASLLRRFLEQEGKRRQLLINVEGSQGHD